jgi:hypothetical protein
MKTAITKRRRLPIRDRVMSWSVSSLLNVNKASVRLHNCLYSYGKNLGGLPVSQFVKEWPRERLEKEIYGFGKLTRAELFLIFAQYAELQDYAQTLLDGDPERTCVHCGCTDSRACPGGCHWIFKHKATPTGVCSGCMYVQMGIVVGKFSLVHQSKGKIWLEVNSGPNAGEGTQVNETTLEAAIYKFYVKEF